MTVVYTKSGSRYLLNKKEMTIDFSKRVFKLIEWPTIKVGEGMHIVYRKEGEFEQREMQTSEVIGVV